MFNRTLQSFVPTIYEGITEMDDIIQSEQTLMDGYREEMRKAFYNTFIFTSDESGVIMFEKMLNIVPKPEDDLETRKFAILNRFLSTLPYTIRRLREILARVCGERFYSVVLKREDYFLQIWIEVQSRRQREIVIDQIKRIIPANLILDVQVNFRTHGWVKDHDFTHGGLREYTHENIRVIILDWNEVMGRP